MGLFLQSPEQELQRGALLWNIHPFEFLDEALLQVMLFIGVPLLDNLGYAQEIVFGVELVLRQILAEL